MKTSEKIILLLHRTKITKKELAIKLSCSRPTLNDKK